MAGDQDCDGIIVYGLLASNEVERKMPKENQKNNSLLLVAAEHINTSQIWPDRWKYFFFYSALAFQIYTVSNYLPMASVGLFVAVAKVISNEKCLLYSRLNWMLKRYSQMSLNFSAEFSLAMLSIKELHFFSWLAFFCTYPLAFYF